MTLEVLGFCAQREMWTGAAASFAPMVVSGAHRSMHSARSRSEAGPTSVAGTPRFGLRSNNAATTTAAWVCSTAEAATRVYPAMD